MISREDFDRAVDSFLNELQATAEGLAPGSLSARLESELADRFAILGDPSISGAEKVATAVSIVREYVDATWPELLHESYALYVDLSGGRSHRHP